jgi:hypothetical protein
MPISIATSTLFLLPLAISVPAGETRVLKYFQERMPYGLFVPDTP